MTFFGTGSPRSQTIVPPAFSIFSRALFEKPCAVTVSAFARSPLPRIFTSILVFFSSPAATSDSGVTSAPASKRASRSRTFTGAVRVMNGTIGIASLDVEPFCLPSRMYSGIWPPSKPARIMCEPARDFWPLIPRPE